MLIQIETAHGFLSLQPDGSLQFRNYPTPEGAAKPGPWETFKVHVVDPLVPTTPVPVSPPPPIVTPPTDPLLGCGSQVRPNGESQLPLVTCLHAKIQPRGDVDKVFDATLRISWALRGFGAGLLKKKEGQSNISLWKGQWFAAAIIAWPDGRLRKVMTDVPNGSPAWNVLESVDPKDYVPAMDPDLP